MRVSLLITCVVDVLAPDVGAATVRVLRGVGCDVTCPAGQTCCGQPAWNAGFAEEAAAVARTTLAALEDDGGEVVVAPAGSCATMIRVFWPELFEVVGDHDAAERARRLGARTYELSELLASDRVSAPESDAGALRVAYHHSCHLLRELGVREQPLALLQAAGCELVDWPSAERCCGFGGTFSMKLPETSVAMADEKLSTLPDCNVVVSADSSCLLHLRARAAHEDRPIETRHIAEILDPHGLCGG